VVVLPRAERVAPQTVWIGALGNLGPDWLLYVNLPPDVTLDISPSTEGIDYYEAAPSATEVRLRIFDAGTRNELTDRTTTVVVGQQINLYCTVSSIATTSAFQWNVPGFAISNYLVTADATSAVVVSNFSTVKSNIVFYWVDGATNRTVTCSATVRGQKVVGQAAFNVRRPTADWIAEPNAIMAVDRNFIYPALHFGNYLSPTNKGMLFHFRNANLNGYQDPWFFKWAQLAQSYARGNFILTNNVGYELRCAGLDMQFPLRAWSVAPGDDVDSPGQSTSDSFKLQFQAEFRSYLMFQPILLTPTIPVPIKKIQWSISGVATNDTTKWILLSSPNDFSIPLNNADTFEFPTWTNKAQNGITLYTNWF
jgi:hypothetical protein